MKKKIDHYSALAGAVVCPLFGRKAERQDSRPTGPNMPAERRADFSSVGAVHVDAFEIVPGFFLRNNSRAKNTGRDALVVNFFDQIHGQQTFLNLQYFCIRKLSAVHVEFVAELNADNATYFVIVDCVRDEFLLKLTKD